MRTTKKILSLVLALVMVLSLLPAAAFATDVDYIYVAVSEEGQFMTDVNGAAVAYTPIALDDLAAIDLDTYGLGDYIYDADSA